MTRVKVAPVATSGLMGSNQRSMPPTSWLYSRAW
jgi:hypothetical protein